MAATKLTGSGAVASSDYKYIKYVGTTKSGGAVTIEMTKAICRSNIDWKFAEKDDVVPELEFEGVYADSNLSTGDRSEPWTITLADGITEGPGEILLSVGKFYIGAASSSAKAVALTRGGGSFVVEREYREINADGDPGAVEGRIAQEGGRPKLKLNALQWLTRMQDLYPGIKSVT